MVSSRLGCYPDITCDCPQLRPACRPGMVLSRLGGLLQPEKPPTVAFQ